MIFYCDLCGVEFDAKTGNARYCPECCKSINYNKKTVKEPKLNKMEKLVIRAMAHGDMVITGASKLIFMSCGSVRYHIDKIIKKTGLDARKFYDLCELLDMAEEKNG